MLNTSLLNETNSANLSLKNTGRKQNTIRTSMPLTPVPKSNQQGLPETLHSLQADSPANRLVKLEEEKERQMIAISGQQCLSQLDLSNQTGSSLRMLRGLLLGTKVWFSNKCVLIWKKKVTKSNRLLYQLVLSTRRIEGTESGLLPTVRAQEPGATTIGYGKSLSEIVEGRSQKGSLSQNGLETGLKLQPNFVEWMMGFPEGWTEIPDSKLLEMRSFRKLRKKSLEEFL